MAYPTLLWYVFPLENEIRSSRDSLLPLGTMKICTVPDASQV